MTDEGLNRIILALAVAAGAFLLFPAGVLALGAPLAVWWAVPRAQAPPKDAAWLGAALCVLWLWWPVRDGWEAAALAHLGTQAAYLPRLSELDGARWAAWSRDTLHPAFPLGLLAGFSLIGFGAVKVRGGGAPEPAPVERHPSPPAIPARVVKTAATGAVPVVTAGRFRKRTVPALPLGFGPRGEPVALTGAQLTAHGLVVGLTGAGKTTFMAEQIRAARALGWAVVCLDLKGSPSLRRLFYELDGGVVWTPRGPVSLDLLRGYPDEVAAKIVTVAGTVTGQQFNQIAQGRLTELVKELDGAGEPRTFPSLQALLARETKVDKPQQALVDLEARLRTVTASTAEPWLRPGPDALHLERAVRDGRAVLLSVPVPRLRLVGEKLGAWALAEANRVASRLTATDWGQKMGRRCLLLVDEFAGLKEQGAHVAQPLAMVREGGVSIWLYTQTLSGLKRLGDVAYSEILGNVNVQVVMRQSEPDDQAALSELLGEYTTQEFSRPLDGETGQPKGDFRPKAVTKPYVTPGQIAALPVGQGYVRIAGGRPVATVFPNVAGATAEEPDVEAEDDDGTPVIEAGQGAGGGGAPMEPDPHANEVVDVGARTVEPAAGESVSAVPGDRAGDRSGDRDHRATPPRRGSRHFK